MNTTDDAFLDGKLSILQPANGYRAGIDPVFLAAATGAVRGDKVLDLGAGVGVASLCLARRVEGLSVLAVELQPELVGLARRNADRNGLEASLRVVEADVMGLPSAGIDDMFDHVITNPPFHDPEEAMSAPNPVKAVSHMASRVNLTAWFAAALKRVRPQGRLTLIHQAEKLPALLDVLDGPAGDIRVFPLWPRAGIPAKRLLITCTKGSAAKLSVLPGLVLHGQGRSFTPQAEEILRNGAACPI